MAIKPGNEDRWQGCSGAGTPWNAITFRRASQPLRGLLPVSLLGEHRHDVCEQFA